MRIQGDAAMASVRAAVSEQRAAALALDPGRLSAANAKLDAALADASKTDVKPEALRSVMAQMGKELQISAEVIDRGKAAGDRAGKVVAEEPVVYSETGAPVPEAPTPRPIAAA